MKSEKVFKSKTHRVRVTQADLNYIGSITIDEDLMEAANMIEGEKVQIVNNNNGERFETYTIRGSGVICLNGAAARRVQVGDIVIIISYAYMTPEEAKDFRGTAVFPDENNRLVKGKWRLSSPKRYPIRSLPLNSLAGIHTFNCLVLQKNILL
ncbi:MAG: aspartate 1-decarboxylase [Phycisphaerae bacterium]|nr:aspartate 1-decarboxylase [Saprospiraceae bacterium]